MVVPSSSVNMEWLKDGNVELCRLFVVILKISSVFFFFFFFFPIKSKIRTEYVHEISV